MNSLELHLGKKTLAEMLFLKDDSHLVFSFKVSLANSQFSYLDFEV